MPVFGNSGSNTQRITYGNHKTILEEKCMKRLTLALLALLLFFSMGCKVAESPVQDDNAEYLSDIPAEDCYLCGDGIENLNLSCWGQKNVAFVSLNTFEVIPIEINRYDKADGHLIEEYTDLTSFEGSSNTDNGFSTQMLLNYNRGFASGALEFHSDETLDVDKAASFLCTDCLNGLLEPLDGPYFGVGVIDLETKKFQVLGKRLGGFGLGDYFIFCKLQEQEDAAPLRMNLLIFNAPVRYKNWH